MVENSIHFICLYNLARFTFPELCVWIVKPWSSIHIVLGFAMQFSKTTLYRKNVCMEKLCEKMHIVERKVFCETKNCNTLDKSAHMSQKFLKKIYRFDGHVHKNEWSASYCVVNRFKWTYSYLQLLPIRAGPFESIEFT